MGKETLRIMDRYHQNKKRLSVLYEDRMVLENVDFVKAKDYTGALESVEVYGGNSGNPQNIKCDKKTSLQDKVIHLMEKKNLIEFEISVLKTEIQLVDNAVRVLESETEIKDEFLVFRTRHLERKTFEAVSAITGNPYNWCWRAVNKMEVRFETLYGVDFYNARRCVDNC